ncbi:MAG: HAD hydrolase-like protein [Actinomycetales bacterium]|nr:HAD hydrolase-like protein [Actinomycetales bacterium]
MNTTLTRNWTSVLFDLDGTILDSAPGIVQSLVDTFTHIGLPIPSQDELIHYVGPPLLDSLRNRAGLSEEDAQKTLQIYRTDYRKDGAFDSAVFPGIVGVLESLTAANIPLAIATSKPEAQAMRILDHFNLSRFFTVVAGATEDETRATKADIVGHALAELAEAGHDTSLSVMVGDRIYDVEGAAAYDVPSIIVEWGYGSPAEAKGAMATVYSTDRLRELLLGG